MAIGRTGDPELPFERNGKMTTLITGWPGSFASPLRLT